MLVVGEVEERLLVDTVGRVLDIGIDEEEDDSLPDMVGSNVGSEDDSSPEVVLLVGTAEGGNIVPAGEGDSVIGPPEEDETLGDGEEEAPSPPSDDDVVGFNVVGKPVGE